MPVGKCTGNLVQVTSLQSTCPDCRGTHTRPLGHFNGGQKIDLEMEGFPPWETIGQCGGTDHLCPVQKQLSSKRNAEHIDALTLAVPVPVRALYSGAL